MTPQLPEYQQVPNPPPAKKGPSCWAIGGIGCVVVILIFAILGFIAVQKVLHSKEGKGLVGSIQGAMQGAQQAGACDIKLAQIDGAITRFHEKNGVYPANLNALIPAYLPDASVLQCSIEGTNPTKSPFVYTKPTASSAPTDKIVNFVWVDKMVMGGQATTIRMNYYFTISGKQMVQQAMIDPTGRVTVSPPREQPAGSGGG